jgi:hypothetical protein
LKKTKVSETDSFCTIRVLISAEKFVNLNLWWSVHHRKLTCSAWWIARTRNTKLVTVAVVSFPCRQSEKLKSSMGVTKPFANVNSKPRRWSFSLMLF